MIAVADYRVSGEIKSSLEKFGYKTISLPPSKSLQGGISSHADMLLFYLDKNLIIGENYYTDNKSVIDEIIKETGFNLIISENEGYGDYPFNVSFNAAAVGKYLITNKKFTAKEILCLANNKGLKTVNIKQGYAKCSICIVNDNAVITADEGIEKTLLNETDIDVLKISQGFIELPPYEYGFIGGATGSDLNNVYFCGELKNHPDSDKIIAFCKKCGKKAVSLSRDRLKDYGTIFLF